MGGGEWKKRSIHGRGLLLQPMVQDVESFRIINAEGKKINVSREENAELFGLVIGGYGLFGVITEVDLRLSPRQKLKRHVEIINLSDFAAKTSQRINDGYLYGDLQFKTDGAAEDFLTRGVYSFYKPVPLDSPIPQQQRKISSDKWKELLAFDPAYSPNLTLNHEDFSYAWPPRVELVDES